MHTYKIGEWFEIGAFRYLVFRVEPTGYWGVAKNGCIALCNANDTEPKHLPGCTGWDWKPTPREWWVNEYTFGVGACYDTESSADRNSGKRIRRIKVREVIE
jgi:hypothetical protein